MFESKLMGRKKVCKLQKRWIDSVKGILGKKGCDCGESRGECE